MSSIELKSRAKINLSIDVLGKREDGYHLVENDNADNRFIWHYKDKRNWDRWN